LITTIKKILHWFQDSDDKRIEEWNELVTKIQKVREEKYKLDQKLKERGIVL